MNSFNELNKRLSSLNEGVSNQLKSILKNYIRADNFIKNGSAEELDFFVNTLNIDNRASFFLEKVFNKLSSYDYSKTTFFETLASRINTPTGGLKSS